MLNREVYSFFLYRMGEDDERGIEKEEEKKRKKRSRRKKKAENKMEETQWGKKKYV